MTQQMLLVVSVMARLPLSAYNYNHHAVDSEMMMTTTAVGPSPSLPLHEFESL